MPELNLKPFEAASGFLKRIFKGSPAYYAKPDLQQYFDSIEHSLDYNSKIVLGDVTGGVKMHYSSRWNNSRTVFSLRLVLDGATVLTFGKTRVTFRPDVFDYSDIMPFLGNAPYIVYGDEVHPTNANITNVVLLARKRTVTFLDDPDKAGITGPGMTTSLESSDVVEHYDYSLGVIKGSNIPDQYDGKEVLCVVSQFTFYFLDYWRPTLIQNFRQPKDAMDAGSPMVRFPILNKVLSPFGQIDWFYKVMGAINSEDLKRDGSNTATSELYLDLLGSGLHKFITERDYANINVPGIIKLANNEEALNPYNATSAITPSTLYAALGTRRRVYDLGVWNMDDTDMIVIPHGLGVHWDKAIPSVCGIIKDDRTQIKNLFSSLGGSVFLGFDSIYVDRLVGGAFDSIDYNSTTLANRGYLIVDVVNESVAAPLLAPIVNAGLDSTLVIALGAQNVVENFTGVIVSMDPGANVIGRTWGIVNGPSGAVVASTGPNSVNYTFSTPGEYTLMFSVTISDGTDTTTGTDTVTVNVVAEAVELPMASLKWSDGTTSVKSYTGNTPYPILLYGLALNLGATTKSDKEFAYRVRLNSTMPWGPWVYDIFEEVDETPNSNTAAFLVTQNHGEVSFKVRFRNSEGVWSADSNILLASVKYTLAPTLFAVKGPFVLSLPTGAVGVLPAPLCAGVLKFQVLGVFADPTFRFQAISQKVYTEYDPNNVQTLPNPVNNYAINTKLNIPGIFDCNNNVGRLSLASAICTAINNIGVPVPGEPEILYVPYIQANYGGEILDVGNTFVIMINLQLGRGSTLVNQQLQIYNPPTLAASISLRVLLTELSKT